jgi:excisionase family DNA binding protein
MNHETTNERRGLIGYTEAAKLLGIALPTLYSKVSRRQVPHVRFGRRCVRFDEAALREYIAQHAVPPTSGAN